MGKQYKATVTSLKLLYKSKIIPPKYSETKCKINLWFFLKKKGYEEQNKLWWLLVYKDS